MTALDIIGYWASTMVFLTFVTTDMRLLRILALISNVAFLSYGLLAWLPPVFFLSFSCRSTQFGSARYCTPKGAAHQCTGWWRECCNSIRLTKDPADWLPDRGVAP